jgi:hypothetical protein
VREGAPDVGLEEHDDRDDDVGAEIPDHPVDGLELKPVRQKEQADQEAAAERHLHGASAPNQQQQLVNEERHQRDVEQIRPRHRRPVQ